MLTRILAWKNRKPSYINRYTVVLLAFFIWLGFVDRHSFMTHRFLSKRIEMLEEEKVFYEKEYKASLQLKEGIDNDIEKFAREKYYMHRPDEEVFVFIDGDNEE